MCKEELEKIIKKLEDNEEFIKKYDIKLLNDISPESFFIKINRKERPMEERLVYNPSVSVDALGYDYFCFKINYSKGYISNVITTYPVNWNSWDTQYQFWKMRRIPDIEIHKQTILMNEVNIQDIIKYIDNTEWITINKQSHDTYFAPSNGYLCDKCKYQLTILCRDWQIQK